jgi:hypothetical protein
MSAEADFDFDLRERRHRVTREAALQSVLKYAKHKNPPFTATGYRASSPVVSVDTLNRMFGSFRAACEAAGLDNRSMKREYSDDELVDAFIAICRDRVKRGLSAVPAIFDFRDYRERHGEGPSQDVFTRRFGSFPDFKKLYARHHSGEITREKLIRLAKTNTRPAREPISPRIRALVLKRDGSKCVTCGRHAKNLKTQETLEVDHRIPVIDGGTSDMENLQIKCSKCNRGKGAAFRD